MPFINILNLLNLLNILNLFLIILFKLELGYSLHCNLIFITQILSKYYLNSILNNIVLNMPRFKYNFFDKNIIL